MNFKKIRLITLAMCIFTLISGLSGCSFLYELDNSFSDETAADSVYSELIADSAGESEITDGSEPVAAEYSFRSENLLNSHFEKHNEDFNYTTAEEYVEGANRVINDKNSLHKLEAEDGDDVYYLEETNEFVIVSTDGYIRTYFKPNQGIDYYNRQ